ncbi:MAG: hypothetical protein JNL81_15100 [Hyphomonadaceae bacterium]|nr:hypothetical protein [Hyphomonadaceae bacterium]
MNVVPSFVSQHRLKRFVAWAMLLLVWTMQFLFTATRTRRRHIDQRWFGIDQLARLVAAIVLIRAVQLVPIRRSARRHAERFNTRVGFRRRITQKTQLRAILGARLRKQFYARDPFLRLGLLINLLRNLDSFAVLVGARGARGLTRLRAISLVRPPHDARPPLLPRPVACADSS